MPANQVWTCIEWDDVTSTCTVEGWANPPSVFPTLTAAEGGQIAWAMVLLIAVGWTFRMMKKPLDL